MTFFSLSFDLQYYDFLLRPCCSSRVGATDVGSYCGLLPSVPYMALGEGVCSWERRHGPTHPTSHEDDSWGCKHFLTGIESLRFGGGGKHRMRSRGCGDEDDGVGGRVSDAVHGHMCKFSLAVGRSCTTGFVLRQR